MSEILIKAEHVSKKFSRSLKRSLLYGVKDVIHSLNPFVHDTELESDAFQVKELRPGEFWALQDISFEVRRGECLGLIGHNGAGKSTLLKILNSLIRPDTGRITMKGRIGSLIELSAGFNPILTGRENIYGQAALLGFNRRETAAKFDAIVDFSELEEFLDMPLQNYSSGMKIKLGFAVSSQMEPDILLIDEVLAVGDVGFRFKCLNRMAELQKNCATIFVSHSMTQVMRVSNNVMVLGKGKVDHFSHDVGKGLAAYYNLFGMESPSTTGSGELTVVDVQAITGTNLGCNRGDIQCNFGDSMTIIIDVGAIAEVRNAVAQILFWNQELIPVLDVYSGKDHGFQFPIIGKHTRIRFDIERLPLNAGKYSVSIILTAPSLRRVYCQLDHAFNLTVCTGNHSSGAGCLIEGNWEYTAV